MTEHDKHLNNRQIEHAVGLLALVTERIEIHGDQQQTALARAAAEAVEALQRELVR